MFRQITKAILPNLERDLTNSVHKQVSAMDDLMLMAPRVFRYQNSAMDSGSAAAGAGAFGRTALRQQASVKLVRVEKRVAPKGLFFE